MKALPALALALTLSAALWPSAFAQTIDENTRLMQDYMARRAEWVAVRQKALDQVKDAKTPAEKKQHLDKLADDEKPLLAKMGEAARAYKAAEKTKRDALAASKPRG